jgi:hypothetical protein
MLDVLFAVQAKATLAQACAIKEVLHQLPENLKAWIRSMGDPA